MNQIIEETFNRTTMELKLEKDTYFFEGQEPFNRTTMELKWYMNEGNTLGIEDL